MSTASNPRLRRIVAFVPDLMDRSRLVVPNTEVIFVSDPTDLITAEADLVVVDLSRPGVIEVLVGVDAPSVGFASHVDESTIAAGRAAGCDQVLTRSQFFNRFKKLALGSGS